MKQQQQKTNQTIEKKKMSEPDPTDYDQSCTDKPYTKAYTYKFIRRNWSEYRMLYASFDTFLWISTKAEDERNAYGKRWSIQNHNEIFQEMQIQNKYEIKNIKRGSEDWIPGGLLGL